MLTFDLTHPRSRDARVALRALSTQRLAISVGGGIVALLTVHYTVLGAVLIAGLVLWDVVHVLAVKRDPFLSQPPNKRLEPSPPCVEEAVGLSAQQHSLGLRLGAPARVGRRGSGAAR